MCFWVAWRWLGWPRASNMAIPGITVSLATHDWLQWSGQPDWCDFVRSQKLQKTPSCLLVKLQWLQVSHNEKNVVNSMQCNFALHFFVTLQCIYCNIGSDTQFYTVFIAMFARPSVAHRPEACFWYQGGGPGVAQGCPWTILDSFWDHSEIILGSLWEKERTRTRSREKDKKERKREQERKTTKNKTTLYNKYCMTPNQPL